MGTGDWNDGMNRVGRLGRGESVWMGFFLYRILEDVLPLCERRGDAARVAAYVAYRDALVPALEDAWWDGAWYRRAYDDAGIPLGSRTNSECRIDALAQAWSVLSGAVDRTRAEQAMAALHSELVDEDRGLIRLLTPPFVDTPQDPGYIKGYVAGVRENGGQYTHAACWAVMALAELGHNARVAPLLERLTPVWHTRTPERLARVSPLLPPPRRGDPLRHPGRESAWRRRGRRRPSGWTGRGALGGDRADRPAGLREALSHRDRDGSASRRRRRSRRLIRAPRNPPSRRRSEGFTRT
ncbi:hypothetical protein [Thiocapsa sp.]|uniref:GH36-type glycosyl hydrolase domain-containing protein n=1 Tax=Thiocapsa sp. TaxID=2024551 RepID=UPI0026266507|nr:hypothetical protein [Thiocapsa sp.]